MKRILIWLLLFFIFISVTGCTEIEKSGFENYQKQTCSVGLTANMFPCDDFLSKFQFINGNYHYRDYDEWKHGHAKTLTYVQYTPEVYEEAKAFCMDYWTFCEKHRYEYNGFIFAEQLCYETQVSDGEYQVTCRYPEILSMWCYNDDLYTLVFLGYYNGNPDNAERKLAETDFPQFLEKVYSEYYSFDMTSSG